MIDMGSICIDCDLRCIGTDCPYFDQGEPIKCERCGDELSEDEAYQYEASEYCRSCLIDQLMQDEIIRR